MMPTIAFTSAMERLGPFEPNPALAIAVSGGADSMALALLADEWARRRLGSAVALVVDHGLRPASAAEARITIERLTQVGIEARLLILRDLKHGPALAERARIMRYQILSETCMAAGILHLLLGHHLADQVETLSMRLLHGSQTYGLAGMSSLRATTAVRLLRPLLAIEPTVLRQFLIARGIAWVEDPSNQDVRAMRPRLRHRLESAGWGETGLYHAMTAVGRLRCREEAKGAAELAERAVIRPEGFALLSPGRIGTAALRSLITTIGGTPYLPSPAQITGLALEPRPATVAGVRIATAGRLGQGLLVIREEAAIGRPVAASADAIWDNRFRLIARQGVHDGAVIDKLGSDAARFRRCSDLPSFVLRTLPALRIDKVLAAVPHLGYKARDDDPPMTMLFVPPRSAAGPAFVPSA